MIHTYHYTFESGVRTALKVDTASNPPKITSIPEQIPLNCLTEYRKWIDLVIAPSILDLLSKEQVETCAEIGKKFIKL